MINEVMNDSLQSFRFLSRPFQSTSTAVVSCVALLLLTFRIWKFTIRPLLHPREPKELPYWIPYIGHTIAYVRSGHDVVIRARAYFGNTRKPFALQLKDRKMYFVLHPDDTTEVYKNTTTLVFDRIVHQLQRTFGISEGTMNKFCAVPASKEEDPIENIAGVPNPGSKSLADLSMDFWRMQLVGTEYRNVETKIAGYVAEILAEKVSLAESSGADISLLELSREVIVGAAMRATFGSKLLEMYPDFVAKYIAFDAESWKVWFQWPFSKSMYASKKAVEDALAHWLEVPVDERGDMSFMVRTVEKTQRALGTPPEDLARFMHLLIFVINNNNYKATFWSLAYILTDPTIKGGVQSEAKQALMQMSNDEYLSYLREQTPHMTAVFHEALRYYSASSSIRFAVAPTPVGSKIVPANSVIFIPFRPLHFDGEVFGPDVDSFNSDRFIRNKKLASSQNFRPFSGGTSYCPGRTLARQEFAVFVTELLGKYDIEVLGGGDGMRMPQVDEKTPTKGIRIPKKGDDIRLKISRKKT